MFGTELSVTINSNLSVARNGELRTCLLVGCSIGSCAAAFLSMQRGLLTEEAYHSILMSLQNLNLPTRLTEIDENGKLVFQPDFDENDILEASKNDKKRNGNKIRFILLSGIGNGIMMDDVSDEEILLASKSIL